MSDVTKIKLPDNSELNIKDYRIPGVDSTPTSGSNNVVTSGGIHTAIADTELVVATALNDLNDRVSDLEDGAETLESDSVWESGTGTNSVIIKGSLGTAGGNNSTVEGKGCITGGNYTENTLVVDDPDQSSGSYGHAEGRYTISCGLVGSHAEGNKTLASGNAAHAEGQVTVASGSRSHAEGTRTLASGVNSHAEGSDTLASGTNSHAEGSNTIANGTYSHVEGWGSKTNGSISHAEGICTIAEGSGTHAEGMITRSIGLSSHSECGNWWFDVLITGDANATQYEIVEDTTDTPLYELYNSVGSEIFTNLLLKSRLAITGNIAATSTPIISVTSVSLVNNIIHASITVEKTLSDTAMTNASGGRLNMTMAYGNNSHSEASVAWAGNTHAEGFLSTAMGLSSHSEGRRTITKNSFEHAEGSYNISNKASDTYGNAGNTQHSIGIGSYTERKNAVEVMQNGDVYMYGVGSYNGTNPSSASTVQNVVNGKQDTLISGTNIKTINNESLLGSGNVTITGSGEANVIETVKVNGTALTVTDKAVNVPVKWIAGTGSNSIITVGSGGTSSGIRSSAEGYYNTASGNYSHAEGYYTTASGLYAHSEGGITRAEGNGSHAEGGNTVASNNFEHAQGRYNVSNKVENSSFGDAGNTIHSVGIGTANNDKKNAFEIMQNGDAYLYGVGSYDGTNYSSASTLQSVINNAGGLPSVTSSDNNKVLTVVSGAWAAATAPSGGVTDVTVGGTSVVSSGTAVIPAIPSAPGTLDTTATTAQSTSASEVLSGSVTLHKVAKTGTYSDLIGTPTIPAAQVQSDWNATSGMGVILNKPTIPTVESLTTSEIDTIWNNAT